VFKTVGKKPIKDCQFLFGAYTCMTDSNSSSYADCQHTEPIAKLLEMPTERLNPLLRCAQLLINLCRSLSINRGRRINRGAKVGGYLPARAPETRAADAISVRARCGVPLLAPIEVLGRCDTRAVAAGSFRPRSRRSARFDAITPAPPCRPARPPTAWRAWTCRNKAQCGPRPRAHWPDRSRSQHRLRAKSP
jgi:hypothetical protein